MKMDEEDEEEEVSVGHTRSLFPATDDVEAGGDDVLSPAPLDEVVVHGEEEEPVCGVDVVRGESEGGGGVLDQSPSVLDRQLTRLLGKQG